MSAIEIKRKLFGKRNSRECFYCRKRVTFAEATVDHYISKAHGGSGGAKNAVVACVPCNNAKGGAHPHDFVMKRAGLR